VENSLHLHYNLKAKKFALHHSPLLPIPITTRITSEWIITYSSPCSHTRITSSENQDVKLKNQEEEQCQTRGVFGSPPHFACQSRGTPQSKGSCLVQLLDEAATLFRSRNLRQGLAAIFSAASVGQRRN
jgi:hypothetical protein